MVSRCPQLIKLIVCISYSSFQSVSPQLNDSVVFLNQYYYTQPCLLNKDTPLQAHTHTQVTNTKQSEAPPFPPLIFGVSFFSARTWEVLAFATIVASLSWLLQWELRVPRHRDFPRKEGWVVKNRFTVRFVGTGGVTSYFSVWGNVTGIYIKLRLQKCPKWLKFHEVSTLFLIFLGGWKVPIPNMWTGTPQKKVRTHPGRSSHGTQTTQTSLPKVLVYPGAFNMTTGPAHYQVLARARAVDTQSYATWLTMKCGDHGWQSGQVFGLINSWQAIYIDLSYLRIQKWIYIYKTTGWDNMKKRVGFGRI